MAEAAPADEWPQPALAKKSSGQGVRYALKPGLTLVPDTTGGLLLAPRPLFAMRLNRQAFTLLSGLKGERTAAELAAQVPSLSVPIVSAFLDKFARRRLVTRKPSAPLSWPTVSVVVPAHGRPEATRACIASLLALDYPTDRLEIIVVDDASEPPLAPSLADMPVRVLREERNIGQSAARNRGAAQATGDLLAFIDNDCVAAVDWLRTLVPQFGDPAVGIVGGRVLAPDPNSDVAAFEVVRSPLDMGSLDSEVGPGESVAYLPTCNLLVRRDLLLRQGGFDPDMRLGEDVDFVWRSLREGARACYTPAGCVVHHHRIRLWDLLCRRTDYGSSEATLQQRHPAGWRVMPLPLLTLTLLTALTLAPLFWEAGLLLGITALVGATIEFVVKRRKLIRLGASLPILWVSSAIWREHVASLYYLSANATRYYGVPLFIVGLLWWPLFSAVATLLLVAPIGDYRRMEPKLPLAMFVGLYWLEMAAYQVGVWRGWVACNSTLYGPYCL
jgi:mycofactocin system glycosyltransferase